MNHFSGTPSTHSRLGAPTHSRFLCLCVWFLPGNPAGPARSPCGGLLLLCPLLVLACCFAHNIFALALRCGLVALGPRHTQCTSLVARLSRLPCQQPVLFRLFLAPTLRYLLVFESRHSDYPRPLLLLHRRLVSPSFYLFAVNLSRPSSFSHSHAITFLSNAHSAFYRFHAVGLWSASGASCPSHSAWFCLSVRVLASPPLSGVPDPVCEACVGPLSQAVHGSLSRRSSVMNFVSPPFIGVLWMSRWLLARTLN